MKKKKKTLSRFGYKCLLNAHKNIIIYIFIIIHKKDDVFNHCFKLWVILLACKINYNATAKMLNHFCTHCFCSLFSSIFTLCLVLNYYFFTSSQVHFFFFSTSLNSNCRVTQKHQTTNQNLNNACHFKYLWTLTWWTKGHVLNS